jgi:hypothetical protein
MGIKKLKDLFFGKDGGQKKKPSLSVVQKSEEKSMEATKERSKKSADKDNVQAKREVELLQKAIAQKLKDPAMAKKAAQILEEMLNGKK